MKKTTLIIFIFLSFFLISPSVLFSGDSIKIAMGYIPNVQFAPYYIAEEKGYFQEQDLNVTFDYGMSTDIMSLVASGQVDFGISDGDQVIVARDKGLPVRVIYTMYVKYPVAVVSFRERGIENALSLAGKRVGIPGPYGSNYFGLKVVLSSAGLTTDDIDLKYIGYTQVESLIADRVDASVVFINNEPVVLREMGKEVNIIDSYSITPMPSAAIITSDSLIQKNPALVRRFVKAVTKAGNYALDNRDEIIHLLKKHVPTLTASNMDINRKVLFASLDLWIDEDIEKHGLGYTTKEDWELSIEKMHSLGLIGRLIDPDQCFTNRFIERWQ